MALAEKAPHPQQPLRRIWKKPKSRTSWLWLIFSLLLYADVSCWYFTALKTHSYPGPALDPFRIFGVIAFSLVILVAAYSLRRRFVRILPGRVEGWLWLHTWFGIVSLLIAFQHEAYLDLPSNFSFSLSNFVRADFGVSALYGLMLLVVTGSIGRLLDVWLARVIAIEANKNGAGIMQSVEERLHEQDLLIERLCAGKSPAFKQFCNQALRHRSVPGPSVQQQFTPQEQKDFQRARAVLTLRAQMKRSLQRQRRAHLVIRSWRYIHISLACIALFFISIHGLLEIGKIVLQLLLHP